MLGRKLNIKITGYYLGKIYLVYCLSFYQIFFTGNWNDFIEFSIHLVTNSFWIEENKVA